MIDMAQADRTLYWQPSGRRKQYRLEWVQALNRAAEIMGYQHFLDVPDCQTGELKALTKEIRESLEEGNHE